MHYAISIFFPAKACCYKKIIPWHTNNTNNYKRHTKHGPVFQTCHVIFTLVCISVVLSFWIGTEFWPDVWQMQGLGFEFYANLIVMKSTDFLKKHFSKCFAESFFFSDCSFHVDGRPKHREEPVFQNVHIGLGTAWNLHEDLDAFLEKALEYHQNNIMEPLWLRLWNVKSTELSPSCKCTVLDRPIYDRTSGTKHVSPSFFLLF